MDCSIKSMIYDLICDRTIVGGGTFGETKGCGRKTMMSHQLLCLHNVYNVPLRTMYCTHCLHNVQNMYIVQCVVCTMCTMSAIALEHLLFRCCFYRYSFRKSFSSCFVSTDNSMVMMIPQRNFCTLS